jgi:hypothetical protein
MTGAGEEVIGRLGETFRAWIIANLPDVGEDEVAAVDAVIARIVKRVVREEATPGRSCPSGYADQRPVMPTGQPVYSSRRPDQILPGN